MELVAGIGLTRVQNGVCCVNQKQDEAQLYPATLTAVTVHVYCDLSMCQLL